MDEKDVLKYLGPVNLDEITLSPQEKPAGSGGAHFYGDVPRKPQEQIDQEAKERWDKYMANPFNAEYERLQALRKGKRKRKFGR